jgi:bifunctional UDP-N-acetylglucosamine pyrophosphorylase / glucosamine-1-phosphate N-acetyltransferase
MGGITQMKNITAVILAAGKSKRMKTKTPKILHPLMGKPLINYVLDACRHAGVDDMVVVVGHEKERIVEYLNGQVRFAEQTEQLGTGHAVLQAMQQALADYQGDILVTCGDMPLISPETLKSLIEVHRSAESKISLLTAKMPDPGRLGRIIREVSGSVIAIVEAVDATWKQLQINEVNTGTYLFDADYLRTMLPKIGSSNVQNEIYLTDTISISNEMGYRVESLQCNDYREAFGINNRADFAAASKVLREKINYDLMMSGVTLYDPENTYIEETVEIGNDTTILPGCMITGKTKIGSNCIIGPHARIEDSAIGDNVTIKESVINVSVIGDGTSVGPYAHVRPGTVLGKNARIGNFVETKKSVIGDYSKVPHLSYVGDATVGNRVNIGAGTITCNYDGNGKNSTIIKDNVFIGSNSSLVAPVSIGEGAATGAGSVVTKDVPDKTLFVGNPAKKLKDI